MIFVPVSHGGCEPVARRLAGGELFILLPETGGRTPQLSLPLLHFCHIFTGLCSALEQPWRHLHLQSLDSAHQSWLPFPDFLIP